jgi:hypothetical protein
VGFFLLLLFFIHVLFIFRVFLGIGTLGCKVANFATIKKIERQLAFVPS